VTKVTEEAIAIQGDKLASNRRDGWDEAVPRHFEVRRQHIEPRPKSVAELPLAKAAAIRSRRSSIEKGAKRLDQLAWVAASIVL